MTRVTGITVLDVVGYVGILALILIMYAAERWRRSRNRDEQ